MSRTSPLETRHPTDPHGRRVEPPCPYVGRCGGCTLQDLVYEDQLRLKGSWVQQAIAPLGLKEIPEVTPLSDPWRYRNKIELSFQQWGGKPLILGYHAAGSYTDIVDLDDCLLAPEPMAAVFRNVRSLARDMGLSGWNPRSQRGWLRYLTIRHSRSTGRIGVCVTTGSGNPEAMQQLASRLMSEQPEVSGVWWGIRSSVGDSSASECLELVEGSAYLEEKIGPFRVRTHPLTFVQPNLEQAERIYETIGSLVPAKTAVAWDLYCGMGLVSFYLAQRVGRVYGIDIIEANIQLARENAARNGIGNVIFEAGPTEEVLRNKHRWLGEARPSVVVADPPRSGMHRRVIHAISAARPRTLIYLACGLESGVRDLKQLCEGFPRYRLSAVRAFDMFPQTRHVELLAVLKRRD